MTRTSRWQVYVDEGDERWHLLSSHASLSTALDRALRELGARLAGVAQSVAGGLIIPGEVMTSPSGYPVYRGPDEFLSLAYPERS